MNNKWWLVFKREYLFRVKKKSFIIMTLLMPILFASFIIIPAYVMDKSSNIQADVIVIGSSDVLNLKSNDEVKFKFFKVKSIEDLQTEAEKKEYVAVLEIPQDPDTQQAVLYLLSEKNINVVDNVKKIYQKAVEEYRFRKYNIDPEKIAQIKAPVQVNVLKWSEKGATKSSAAIKTALATIGAVLLYFFMFMYGGLAMRSVMEEKVNRVVELIVSSVRPVELLFGKLLAILFVALTQFIIWFVFVIVTIKVIGVSPKESNFMVQLAAVMEMAKHVNLGLWLFSFVYFFLTGYLFYGSWFAAIGSAVDVETDAQQFVMPLTLPLIFAIIFMQAILFNPDGQLAFWLSIIPFTSPIIMPMRVSFGIGEAVMWWELILSIVLMALSVWASLWATAKIFRMGILFYGKRATYRDFWKWIKQG